jgi:protein-S-isoprenylcysteine O-methyltransferase Ste14
MKNLLGQQGNFLFKWRSYLPIAMCGPLFFAITQMNWPLGSHSYHQIIEALCMGVSVLGLAIRVMTIGHTPYGTSGRNSAQQVATQLNTSGIYSVVRHPLYLGNFLIGLGPVLLPMIWWLPVIYVLAFALYYERIMIAEEEFLKSKFQVTFTEWASKTPAFIPKLSGWRSPSLAFSLKNVLKREYTAVAQICLGFLLIEIAEHLVIDHRFSVEPIWIAIGSIGVAQYIVLRSLKRHTSLLDVAGR